MRQKFELFPTILECRQYPEYVEIANQVCDEYLDQFTKDNPDACKYSVKHGYSMHGDPKLKPLVDSIGQSTRNFLTDQGYDLDNHVVIFESFWPQEFAKKGGGFHDIHIHPNSHISGFYFLKCSDKTSFPIFHDPRFGKNMIQLPEKDINNITAASSIINFKPIPGMMFIFNSFLPHSYSLDQGIDPFRFIHFTMQVLPRNYFPQG